MRAALPGEAPPASTRLGGHVPHYAEEHPELLAGYRPLTGRHNSCDTAFHVGGGGGVDGDAVHTGWWMRREAGEVAQWQGCVVGRLHR